MQECPCGFWGDRWRACRCTDLARDRYRSRLSGPLLDRIDLHVAVPAVPFVELIDAAPGESSAMVRARVARVRRVRAARETSLPQPAKRRREASPWLALDADGKRLLERAHEALGLTARAHTRILQVARTIADLATAARIEVVHLAEAIQYRALDREAALEAARDR